MAEATTSILGTDLPASVGGWVAFVAGTFTTVLVIAEAIGRFLDDRWQRRPGTDGRERAWIDGTRGLVLPVAYAISGVTVCAAYPQRIATPIFLASTLLLAVVWRLASR